MSKYTRIFLAFIAACNLYASPVHALEFGSDARGAATLIKAGDYVAATFLVGNALQDPTSRRSKSALKLLKTPLYSQGLFAQAASANTLTAYNQAIDAIKLAEGGGVISPADAATGISSLRERYHASVEDRTLRGVIWDKIELTGGPSTEEFNRKLLDNTIYSMGASEIPASQADRLFSFVATRTDPWVLKSRLETRLNDMRFSIEALRGPVARAFPSYAAAELDRRVVPIFVSVDGDQLFGLDLKDAFRSVESVSLTDSKGEARTSIVVKQLGLVVASVPPETQTIRYAQYEVNLLLGALLMPNNATYQYELMTGGAEIEYAFEVTVTSSTGSTEFLLRDRQREQWSHCSGARVVNVFGGAEPVTWNANADMTRRCGSSSPQISLSDIRKALAAKIAVDIATRLVERQSTTSVASSP